MAVTRNATFMNKVNRETIRERALKVKKTAEKASSHMFLATMHYDCRKDEELEKLVQAASDAAHALDNAVQAVLVYTNPNKVVR